MLYPIFDKSFDGLANVFVSELECFNRYKQEYNTSIAWERSNPLTSNDDIKIFNKIAKDWFCMLDYYYFEIKRRVITRKYTDQQLIELIPIWIEETKAAIQDVKNATRGRGL
jgi:hypothetical protein